MLVGDVRAWKAIEGARICMADAKGCALKSWA